MISFHPSADEEESTEERKGKDKGKQKFLSFL
jgi:hypothetical protein